MAQNIHDSPEFFAGYSQMARSVHGLDGAPEWPAIRALLPDLDGKRIYRLDLPGASFDFAYSSLAFHYIEDFDRLVKTVHDALLPGAHFVFTIEHPIYMAPSHPGWSVDVDGRKTWPVNRYCVEGPRTTDWLAKGVLKQHRMLATTLNALIEAGFTIRRVEEWRPTADRVAQAPDLADELERPMMLIVAAQR
ncbi:methyltransferase domain-containing protein [Mesorhizobium sp.]|uniref:class I SAM-dependent methyltransferase n=1 Tax=Mesorhizobium sp. TaxID=1871066 RepID=UPI0011FE45E3|nr:methyltransferase domain-containing protein [Mesorhizobium sp.]TIS99450.1 MAG: class I SAM-dependent methyltransferase [Mesorhizobium sp.]